MPYNSKAFEQQLARYRSKQIADKVSALPDGHHRPQSRVQAEAGQLRPSQLDSQDIPISRHQARLMERGMALPEGMMLVRKKSFLERPLVWVVLAGVIAGVVIPVFFKPQMNMVLARFTGGAASVQAADLNALGTAGGIEVTPAALSTPTGDLGQAMQEAQQRANAIANQGPAQSMKYIEAETKRLQDMARDLSAKANAATTAAPAQ